MKFVQQLLALMLLVTMTNSLAAGAGQESTADDLVANLTHQTAISDYGSIIITEKLVLENIKTAEVPFPDLQFIFPSEYLANILASELSGSMEGPLEVEASFFSENNKTKMRIQPAVELLIPGESSLTLDFRVYLSKLVREDSGTLYTFPLTILPGLNIPVNEIEVVITPPEGGDFDESPEGFERSVSDGQNVWKRTYGYLKDVQLLAVNSTLEIDRSANFALIDFLRVERKFGVQTSGEVMVTEVITLRNYGEREFRKLNLQLLDEDIESVVLIPPVQPPTRAVVETNLINGELDLNSALSLTVAGGQNYTFGIRYRLPPDFISGGENGITLSAPLRPPVGSVIYDYHVSLDLPEGYVITAGDAQVQSSAVPAFERALYLVAFRPKVAWAAGDAIPFASTVFIISFVLLLATRKREYELERPTSPRITMGLVDLFDEKLRLLGQLLREGDKTRTQSKMGRQKIAELRGNLDGLKIRIQSKVNEERSRISQEHPELRNSVDYLVEIERERERSARDILNLFGQYTSGGMSVEVFERVFSNHKKRLQNLSNRLEDRLSQLEKKLV